MRGSEETRNVTGISNDSTVLVEADSKPALFQNFQEVQSQLSDPSVERVLFEANALTSVIVDCMHGVLPGQGDGNVDIEERIVELIQNLRSLSKKKSQQASRLKLHDIEWKKHIDAKQSDLVEKVSFQIWHEISLLRRILARVLKAVRLDIHSKAYQEESTKIPLQTVNDFCGLKNDFDVLIVNQASAICGRTGESKAKWYDFAVMYEATLILRARDLTSPALLLAEKARSMELDNDGFVSDTVDIRGLVSFNPELFRTIPKSSERVAEISGTRDPRDYMDRSTEQTEESESLRTIYSTTYHTPQEVLFSISKAITCNSSGAAAQSITPFYEDRSGFLNKIMMGLFAYIQKHKHTLHYSALLHVESTLRVICHNLINETRSPRDTSEEREDTKNNFALRFTYSLRMKDFYTLLKEVLGGDRELDSWMKQMLLAKMTQDGGILLSNLVPAVLLELADLDENTYEQLPDEFTDDAVAISKLLHDGWGYEWRDCPARIRKEFRRAIAKDLIKRSENLDSQVSLPRLTELIGDPTALNPFTSSRGTTLSPWLWGTSKNTSRHLRHFPQSNINKAQISIIMGYMQLIEKQPDENGFFDDIGDYLLSDEKEGSGGKPTEQDEQKPQWRITNNVAIRPQFTIGHLKKEFNKKHITQLEVKDDKKTSNPFNRSNVTRVNRMDPLMFAATSMNFIEDLIKREVRNGEDVLRRLDSAARQSRLAVNDCLLSDEKVHVHDVIHAAQEAAQSPMRVAQHHTDSTLLEKTELIDQILRVSFSRLYVLTIRVEQLARLLLESPLRQPYQDSSVLIIDQVRVLLKFMHTEWLKGEEKDHVQSNTLPKVYIDKETVKYFHKLKKSKGYLGIYFPSEKYHDRGNKDLIKEDIALEYILSNGLRRRGSGTVDSMRDIIEQNRKRLNFSNISHIYWGDFIQPSLTMNYDGPFELNLEQQEDLSDVLNENDKSSGDTVPPQQSPSIKESFSRVRNGSDREWILWSRLAFFPVCFNGRTIVSSTTFSENISVRDKSATSRLWGELKKAYLSEPGD
jgi:hypothetical protein